MSEDNDSQADGKKIIFPDFAELWKELYFKTEGAWADAFKEFVSTDTFVQMLDQTLTQHLNMEKTNQQNMDKLFEISAIPSKKDIARIAELVIAVEEKVDNLDYQLLDNIKKMADSMITMVSLLEDNQQQFSHIKAQNEDIKAQNTAIKKQNAELKKQNTEMKNQITDMKNQIVALQPKLLHADQNSAGINKEIRSSKRRTLPKESNEPVGQ